MSALVVKRGPGRQKFTGVRSDEYIQHKKSKRLFMVMSPFEMSVLDNAVNTVAQGLNRSDLVRDCIKRGIAQIEAEHGLSLGIKKPVGVNA